jgi:hypothetical protein
MINSTLYWKRIGEASHIATFCSAIGGIYNIRLYMYLFTPIPETVCPPLLKKVLMKI